MSNKEKGNDYEKLVSPLITKFVSHNNYVITNQDGGDKFTLKGKSGCTHQIDVYFECENDTEKEKIIIECKDYGAPISIGKIRDFFAVKYDIGDVTAWFVSRNGFTSMAKNFAKFYDITLITVDNSRIEVKSNTSKPLLGWNYFKLDDSHVEYPCNCDFVVLNKKTSQKYVLSDFVNLFYDTEKLPPRSTFKSVSMRGNWALCTAEKEIPFKKFTLYYHLIKSGSAIFRAVIKDKYTIEANLEKR